MVVWGYNYSYKPVYLDKITHNTTMKKLFLFSLLCVIFSLSIFNVVNTYCFDDEVISFHYFNKIFTYRLSDNIKYSKLFNISSVINKYNRFSSKPDRLDLFEDMISIGISQEVALDYLYPNLSSSINKIEKNIYLSPINASIEINPNNENVFKIKKERYGISLDRISLYNLIASSISNSDIDITIPIIKTCPDIIEQDLSRHTYLRSTFSTDITNSSPDRKHNIKNALTKLNKTTVLPNEVFSFNNTVGRRTEENGYRQAKIIVNNEYVDGLGGGVCQVSSTLYNSALLAGLEIIEANKHSKQISYVPYGFDAMVNYGNSDLKFKNNTNETLTIITNYSSTNIKIRIFGENMDNTYYTLNNEISNIVNPSEEVLYDIDEKYTDKVVYNDEYFYLKSATKGMDIKTYRNKYIDNKLVSKELVRTDKYKVQNSIKMYGIKQRDYSFMLIG